MQIMVEGLALAAFGLMHQITTEPLLKKLLRYVMSDEARHVAFGVLSLQEFYKELTDAEMRERQEFAFDVAKRLQRRFAHTEMWAKMGVDPDAVYRTMDKVNPPAQQMFQQLLFSKIVPNCKKLGLLDASDGWLRERFTEIGVIEFEDFADTGEEYADARRGRPRSRGRVSRVRLPRRRCDRQIADADSSERAADRGLLAAFWAERQPDRGRDLLGGRRSHVRRGRREREPARARAAGAGRAGRRRRRADVLEPARVRGDRGRGRERAGLRLTTINWHLTGDEAGLHRRRLRGDRVRRRRALRRTSRARRGRARAATAARASRSAVTIDGFEAWDDVLAPRVGRRHRRPASGGTMLYTSGTTGRPKGVRRPARSARRRSTSRRSRSTAATGTCTSAPVRCTTPRRSSFSLTAPAAMGVPIVMMDGWSAERDARAHRGARRHAHAHGARRCSTACSRCPTR